jgi:hypothetical protein
MSMFPQSKEDAAMFLKNAVAIIHNEQFQQSFIRAMGQGDPVQIIGTQAATVLHRLISVLRQEKGVPIVEGVAIKGIQFVVEELAAIAKMMGIQLSQEQLAQCAKVAGDATEQLMNDSEAAMRQPQQPQQQPMNSGLMGGM